MKAALVCLGALAACAAPAQASIITVSTNGPARGEVVSTYVTGAGPNDVRVSTVDSHTIAIDEPGATIHVLGAQGCTASGSHAVCEAGPQFHFQLGGGDDTFSFTNTPPDGGSPVYFGGVLYPNGGDGNDDLRMAGGDGSGLVRGGRGDDYLLAVASTGLQGGLGADTIVDGGAPPIEVIGSLRPSASYTENTRVGGVHVTLDGLANDGAPGEGDNVLTSSISGTAFADVLEGDAGDNVLFGSGGADTITGGAGSDVVFGGNGADEIRLRDGYRDEVACERGKDVAVLDFADSLGISWSSGYGADTCEDVERGYSPG
jgi:Ca2+-binding RTX toxin-like protein